LIAISVVGVLAMWTSVASTRVEPDASPDGAVCRVDTRPGMVVETRLLPPCSRFAGMPCNGTTLPRCLLAPGEPAVCVCTNGFFECS